MSYWKRLPSKAWLVIQLLSLVFLAVSCGGAEKAAPTTTPKAGGPAGGSSAPVAAPTPAPTLAAVASPVPKAAPTPTLVRAPATKVNPSKLTIMVGNLGNERFDAGFSAGGPPGHNYARIMHGFLTSTNERTEMIPGIASQWSLSPDGRTWTFTIRKGVKWHDGSELTPQDVLWTFQHYFGPQAYEYLVAGTAARMSRATDRIELSGPDKVSLNSNQILAEFGIFVSEAGDVWFPIMPKRAKQQDTEEELAYDKNPIGAGFMKLVKHVSAYSMKFERFDDFYYQPKNGFPEDKRVNFQSLDLLLVPEEATRVAAVRAGEADIVPVSLATKKQVEAGGGRLVFGQEGVAIEPRLLRCYAPQRPPCHDKRVRQALNYAMDKELIRDRLYGGPEVFQIKAWGPVTPSSIGYTPELDPWPFDPAKARQLLADAGYPGGKGFGKLIVYTHVSTSLPLLPESAQLAAEFWRRELSLDVEVNVLDPIGITNKFRAGELNGQIWWRDNEARIDHTESVSRRFGDPKNVDRFHEDPELFRLVQEAFQIVDSDKRTEASKKLFLRLRDESYVLGIGYVNIPWAVAPRIVTWRPYPLALFPSALHTVTLK